MFSLRSKMFLIVGCAVAFSAAPIIWFSHRTLLERSMEREEESFVNTVMLVEDSISVRYLNLLTSRVEAVLASKDRMRRTSALIREQLEQGGRDELGSWQKVLRDSGMHMAYFVSGRPVLGDPLITAVTAVGVDDFKGRSLNDMLSDMSGDRDARFAVTGFLSPGEGPEQPFLLCFSQVGREGMLVLADPLIDAEEGRRQMEKQLLSSVQERLEALELSRGASVAVLDGEGRLLAGKGDLSGVESVPVSWLARAADEPIQGVEEGTWNVMYRVARFKAMDWYVLAFVPMTAITEPASRLSTQQLGLAVGFLAASLLVMLMVTLRITKPLRLLTRRARELASEDFGVEHAGLAETITEGLPIGRRDEVGELSGAFVHMAKALDENVRRLMETLSVRQRMQGELNAARDIQMGILPPPDGAPRCRSYAASAFLEPAKEMGGDLYDFFTTPDGRQAVVIGDVSDKGVSAALFMSMTVTLIRYALAEGLSAPEAMFRINEMLSRNNPSCMFVTLFIGLFDPETGNLDYASGAHCPPFVVSSDPSVPVRALTETSGPLVGALPGMEYKACHAHLEKGEYCLLYTDGVSEAMDENNQLFGEERIAACLETMHGASPETVIHEVMEAVRNHRGTAAQSDDITMLCFKRV